MTSTGPARADAASRPRVSTRIGSIAESATLAVDAKAKRDGLDADSRLKLYRTESRPVMDWLKIWLDAQIEERKVEPNSTLGQAIQDMRKRWTALTRFLESAHEADERFTVRDGVNVARYALKLLGAGQTERAQALRDAVQRVLGEDALQHLE